MKKLLYVTAFLFFTGTIYSQYDSVPAIKVRNEKDLININHPMPSFPGGDSAMFAFIGSNINYTDSMKIKNLEGKVYIGFVVEKDGLITNIEIIRSPYPELAKEAIRVMKLMPIWIPGRQFGEAIRINMVLPFNFKMK